MLLKTISLPNTYVCVRVCRNYTFQLLAFLGRYWLLRCKRRSGKTKYHSAFHMKVVSPFGAGTDLIWTEFWQTLYFCPNSAQCLSRSLDFYTAANEKLELLLQNIMNFSYLLPLTFHLTSSALVWVHAFPIVIFVIMVLVVYYYQMIDRARVILELEANSLAAHFVAIFRTCIHTKRFYQSSDGIQPEIHLCLLTFYTRNITFSYNRRGSHFIWTIASRTIDGYIRQLRMRLQTRFRWSKFQRERESVQFLSGQQGQWRTWRRRPGCSPTGRKLSGSVTARGARN